MNDRLAALTARYDKLNATIEDETIQKLFKALDSSYRLLEREILASYSRHYENKSLFPIQRKLLIMRDARDYLQLISPAAAAKLSADFSRLLEQTYVNGQQLGALYLEALGDQKAPSFSAIPIEAIAFQAQESAARLKNWSEDMRLKISAIVEYHLGVGAGPKRVAGALREQLGIVKARSEAIARTEANASHNRALKQSYRDAEVSYVQLIATNDRRTCPYCAARAGNIYKIDEITLPSHVNDRCVLAPWDPDWEEDQTWMENFRADVLSQLEATNKKPNNGPAPFEQANGQTAPKPVRTVKSR